MSKLGRWAHRGGVARILNSTSTSMGSYCTAYIEVRGPRFAAAPLAKYALRHSARIGVAPKPDLNSLRVTKVERPGRVTRRVHLAYERVS